MKTFSLPSIRKLTLDENSVKKFKEQRSKKKIEKSTDLPEVLALLVAMEHLTE